MMGTPSVRQFHTLFKKELVVKFRSSLPLWGMGFLQVGMALWLYWIYGFFQKGLTDLAPFFRMLTTVFTLLIPLYTSGEIAEEVKSGNWDLYYSFPVSIAKILGTKFLANIVWLGIHLTQVGITLISLLPFGDFDPGVVRGALLGLGLYGTLILSIGQWISTLRKGTLISYLFTVGVLLFLLLIPFWAGHLPFPDILLLSIRFMSISHHLEGFFRGMILVKDLGFFLGGITVCFILSTKEIGVRMVLRILLLILVVWNVTFLRVGFDWTKKKAYTISPVTKRVLSRLEGRVLISYFFSTPLVVRSSQPELIMELLHAYSRVSDMIDLRIVDPTRTGESRWLIQAGLKTDAEGYFSGITIEYQNELEVIPWIAEPGHVEYLITTHLLRLLDPSKRTIGIVRGGSEEADSEGLYPFLQATGFVLVEVEDPSVSLPYGSTLLVLHGEGLSQLQVEMIDGYLSRGGNLLILFDRIRVDREQNLKASVNPTSGILELFQRMGVSVLPRLVLDRSSLALPVQRGTGKEAERFFLPYPPWPRVKGDGFHRNHPITQSLSSLDLFWASPLVVRPESGVRTTILARTSPDSWLVEEPFPTDPYEAQRSIVRGVDRKGSYPVAILVEKEPSKLIVVGDGQCLGDLLDSTKSYENYAFLLNALEWLSDPSGPLAIRNRFLRDRFLVEVENDTPPVQRLWIVQVFLLPSAIAIGLIWQKVRMRRG
ncbi:MAG: Gldg family protein [Spirochaetes bacterium]|nr:Gldg family protein [Spirochaetota bacterium]